MTSLSEMSVVERYRAAAATWLPALVSSGSTVLFDPVPSAQDDPVAAWAQPDAQVRGLLEDPANDEVTFSRGPRGRTTPSTRTSSPGH